MSVVIGITAGVAGEGRGAEVRVRAGYGEAVRAVGGVPMVVTGGGVGDAAGLAGAVVERVDGLVLTGGDDPLMEAFGVATDGRVRAVSAERQAFDLALLGAAEAAGKPVLGVCLGMQYMCLRAGGRLDQWLLDSLGEGAYEHVPRDGAGDVEHGLEVVASGSLLGALGGGVVNSWHRQGVVEAGGLRVIARSGDGLVEAVDDPGRGFWVGVQWHLERMDWGTGEGARFGRGLFEGLVVAARGRLGV